MTTSASNSSPRPPDETPLPERLWTIGDIAAFLNRCENTARSLIRRCDDTPPPVLVDGAGALWDPRGWWAWAEARATRPVARRHAPGRLAGRSTRV